MQSGGNIRRTPQGGAEKDSPGLSRQSLLVAALEIIDRDGLDVFSLGKLAKSVGITPPSLYHYFSDKAELLSALARELLTDFGARPIRRKGNWKDIMVATCVDARRAVLKHPKAAPLLLLYPPRHTALDGYERQMKILARQGVPPEKWLRLSIALEHLNWGAVQLTAATLARGIGFFPAYDPAEFPGINEAMQANPLDDEAMFIRNCYALVRALDAEEA